MGIWHSEEYNDCLYAALKVYISQFILCHFWEGRKTQPRPGDTGDRGGDHLPFLCWDKGGNCLRFLHLHSSLLRCTVHGSGTEETS